MLRFVDDIAVITDKEKDILGIMKITVVHK